MTLVQAPAHTASL